MPELPLIGAKSQIRMTEYDRNMFYSVEIRGAEKQDGLYGTPGLSTWCNTGVTGENRGAIVANGKIYSVIGNSLVSVDTGGFPAILGTIGTSTGRVSMASNGNQLCIVDGAEGYIWDYTAETLETITRDETGYISGIILDDAGSGYSATPEVTVTSATGSGATVEVHMAVSSDLTLDDGGTGYTEDDILIFVDDEDTNRATFRVNTVDGSGTILTLGIEDFGNYTTIPEGTTFYLYGGTGSGAQITVKWEIISLVLTAQGTGYSDPVSVVFDGGTPTIEAMATAELILDNGGFPVAPTSVCYLDGYFLVHTNTNQQVNYSKIMDGTHWAPLDYYSVEGNPDNVLRIFSDHREVWHFGSESTQVRYNSGAQDLPFENLSGGFLERGIGAPWSVAKVDNTLFWLNDINQVVKADGYRPQIVSTENFGYLLNQMTTLSDAIVWWYGEENRTFYVLTFPTENKTFFFNVALGLWHPWYSGEGRHRGNWCLQFAGKNIVGDFENGKLYEMSLNIYDEDGEEIHRSWVLPVIEDPDRNRIYFNEFEAVLETGLPTEGEDDPQVWIDFTDTAGKTWSTEKWASVGRIGEFGLRCRWLRLGSSRRRFFRLNMSGRRKWAITGVHVKLARGVS